ncbi:hypothetical protein MPEAHAMD_5990 [Methylobacterium frigidaeris]|uniref:Competence protein CoiA-like family protein n=1 Tax=Methylobacterium frigidaeris TaxID=2038277 RepID=A0AA37HHR3_9HYPH|nr:hypothetical protein MPEAHAMD_5990 [Methylobacterium frigidaeris]
MVISRRSDPVGMHATGWAGSDSLVFGERPDGTILHISEVCSGLACNCACPGCKAPLVARKGDLKDHHFGHYGTAETPACQTGAETALHKFAKDCLARRLELFLPAVERAVGTSARARYLGEMFHFDAALLEHRLATIVPNVIVHKGERDLLVELRVSHPCDTVKIADIADLNIAAVEIDLSHLPRDVTRLSLEEAIITQAPRRWLYKPKSRAKFGEEGTQQKATVAPHRFAILVRAYKRSGFRQIDKGHQADLTGRFRSPRSVQAAWIRARWLRPCGVLPRKSPVSGSTISLRCRHPRAGRGACR